MPSWLLLLLLAILRQDAATALRFKCRQGEECVKTCSGSPPASGWFPRCRLRSVCCPIKMQEKAGCGLAFGRSLEGLVIGGKDATPGQWPWMVSILCKATKFRGHIPICTGFLIDHRHVLTAAHCIEFMFAGKYRVRLGEDKYGREVGVSRLLLHPGYRKKIFHDDLALLTLSEDLKHLTPVCLPPASSSSPTTNATLLGWGTTNPIGGKMSERLQELRGVPILSAEACERKLRDRVPSVFEVLPRGIDASLFCAGAEGKDSCRGDSGGPLLVQENGRWIAVGVVAFGITKCGTSIPGVYTSVAYYLPWIESNLQR